MDYLLMLMQALIPKSSVVNALNMELYQIQQSTREKGIVMR